MTKSTRMKAARKNERKLELIYKLNELRKLYDKECEEIALGCEEEVYPANGTNYELRREKVLEWYKEQIEYLEYEIQCLLIDADKPLFRSPMIP